MATGRQVLECGESTRHAVAAPKSRWPSSRPRRADTPPEGPFRPSWTPATPPLNPNHTGPRACPTAQSRTAFPSVGALQAIAVTERNGLGDLGGRVTQMVLSRHRGAGHPGTSSPPPSGCSSDWFAITNGASSGGDKGLLGRRRNGGLHLRRRALLRLDRGRPLNAPVVGDGPDARRGRLLAVASDGGIFSFGDARFYGSTGAMRLNRPVIGMAATPTGRGYWLVGFRRGDLHLRRRPVLRFDGCGAPATSRSSAWRRTPDGRGYWLVAADGGIFTFGDARFYGSTGRSGWPSRSSGWSRTGDGRGYCWWAGTGDLHLR